MSGHNHPSMKKEKALYDASVIIRRKLQSKQPFKDFDFIYGTGVLFPLLTRDEVEELYNLMK